MRKIATLLFLFLVVGIASLYADNSGSGNSTEAQVRATEILQQIKTDYHDVLALQAQARFQKDVIKLNCVNDKLIQIKAEMNIADSAEQSVRLEIATGDKSAREMYFGQLNDSAGQIRGMRQEAAACLGKIELSNEESGATSTHPEFPDDPSVIPFDVYTEPPAYASPFN